MLKSLFYKLGNSIHETYRTTYVFITVQTVTNEKYYPDVIHDPWIMLTNVHCRDFSRLNYIRPHVNGKRFATVRIV